jgi:energy-converting hydrogenase Eha subunit E
MRRLQACLYVGGSVCLLPVLGLLMPPSAARAVVRAFIGEPIPEGPLFWYVFRLMSATYGVIGAFLIILAGDPFRHGRLVEFTGWASVFLGAICAAAGVAARMPALWFLGDAVCFVLFGVLVLLFWRRARAARHAGHSPAEWHAG